jgi:hypothetical protein
MGSRWQRFLIRRVYVAGVVVHCLAGNVAVAGLLPVILSPFRRPNVDVVHRRRHAGVNVQADSMSMRVVARCNAELAGAFRRRLAGGLLAREWIAPILELS